MRHKDDVLSAERTALNRALHAFGATALMARLSRASLAAERKRPNRILEAKNIGARQSGNSPTGLTQRNANDGTGSLAKVQTRTIALSCAGGLSANAMASGPEKDSANIQTVHRLEGANAHAAPALHSLMADLSGRR
jgi:hypothetical protein